jgi:hypothetical protein
MLVSKTETGVSGRGRDRPLFYGKTDNNAAI